MSTDRVVANGDVRLATTDFGGDGPSLVLMPGLGLNRKGFTRLAEHLPGFRVITMDTRGHGESSTAPWDFPAVIADLDAVIDTYQLGEAPYVGGHSLGGMIALQYALAGRSVAGVVNIDGWGAGIADRYIGEDPVVVGEWLDLFSTGELPTRLANVIVARTRQVREGTTRQALGLLQGADVVGWHRDAPCGSLALHATAPQPWVFRRLLGRDATRLLTSYSAGLTRDLAELALLRPDFTVVEVDATHALHRTHAETVAAAIRSFAGSALTQGVDG